ncbi:hypothetical protein CARUB_v10022171mg, partial [Capsella rubella]
ERSPSLPDKLVMNIVARVPRLYHLTLSLVSKRSLMASPELYKVRSLLGNTETCLYFCLRLTRRESQSWFTLCRKPNKTLTNDDHSSNSPFAHFSDIVAVGSYCKIENVAYSTARGTVVWFDTKLGMWIDLQVC